MLNFQWGVDEAPEQTQEEALEEATKETLGATQEEDAGHGQSAKRQRTGAFEVPIDVARTRIQNQTLRSSEGGHIHS